jgi:uncharacterized membrane protein YoaK (UPF0700 family)
MAQVAGVVAVLPGRDERQISPDLENPTSSFEPSTSMGSENPTSNFQPSTSMVQKEQAQQIRKSFKHPARWMLALGFILAACAGMVNVIVYNETGSLVSHQTGSLTKTAMELEGVHMVREFDPQPASEHLLVILSFTFGAFLCGLVIDKNTVHFGGNSFYSVALIGNSALLLAAMAVMPCRGAAYLSAMACGLQNAMCTSHFTAVVRTTHVTGSFTDIGSTSGRIVATLLRRRLGRRIKHVDMAEIWVDGMKLQILLLLCGGFFLGCFFGAYLDSHLGKFSLVVPASITGTVGFSYFLVTHLCKEKVADYEDKQRAESVREVEEHIIRAHEILVTQRRTLSRLESGPQAEPRARAALAAMDGEMEHCLEIVRSFSRDWVDGPWSGDGGGGRGRRLSDDGVERMPTIHA